MKENVSVETVEMQQEVNAAGAAKADERAHVVKFQKPYHFEGKDYEEIDLGGLDSMTIKDAVNAQKKLFGQQEIASTLVCETTTAFAMEIAAAASGMPIEFFKFMPRGAGRAVRLAVQEHINNRSKDEGAVLVFEKPYIWKDQETKTEREYTSVDLSGVANMTIMHETAAENEMTREGIIITENSFNYLYACIIAGMAAKLPKEFFTGLPLRELMKLKDIVNSTDFFE